MKERRL